MFRGREGAARTSQDLRRGSRAAEEEEEEGRSAPPPEQDLVRRSSGSPGEDSIPARRSRRQ